MKKGLIELKNDSQHSIFGDRKQQEKSNPFDHI